VANELIFTRMKNAWFILIVFISACSVSKDPMRMQIKKLQKGEIKEDSSFVYMLPYEQGTSPFIVQGYFGPFSHKNRAAIDFKMKRGTKIVAAREGVVTRVKEDSDRGGWNRKYRNDGNNIVITHADGSRAGYWHLQKDGALVKVGDSVKQGQVIALSGKTGYAAIPHLHFIVWKSQTGRWQQVATRFNTSKGIKYLKGWKKYRRPAE
jgi:murein DD-endopeptidase MepM/ murein hydrolase activator NlpD